ncbi:hypothetical protein [Adhaeribacter aquaticus]|uniref:hypothetical protein n=1 Tax=Adhaeribacter aquaticus TaxID=299567 RepID=UPI00047EF031|nr:hypothetical protein [Adhaeribacter aquaticus]
MKAKSMMPKAKRRRYFLHAELKKTLKVDVKNRVIYKKDNLELDDQTRIYLKELLDFGYICQLTF